MSADWGFRNDAEYKGTGRRVWRLTAPLYYVDPGGNLWVYPEGLSCDLRSSPRWLWWLIPPTSGKGCAAWFAHDMERRCRGLLGLSINEIDMVRFPKQMESAGKSKTIQRIHAIAVRTWAALGVRSKGDGWSGSPSNPDKYDTLVRDGEKWMSLAEWVQRHYRPDGKGYKKSPNHDQGPRAA